MKSWTDLSLSDSPTETVRDTTHRNTASILYKPITDVLKDTGIMKSFGEIFFFKACSGETRIYTTQMLSEGTIKKNKTHSCTHRATNKWRTKWNSSEKQSVSAGLRHFIVISLKWWKHFVQSFARVRTRCKSVPSGESLWSLEPRGQFYLQKNSCEIIPHKLTHSHTKTHTHRPFMPCLKRALGRSKVKSVSKRLAKQSSRGRWFWLAHHALFCRSDTHTRTQLHAKLLAWREERLMSRKMSPVRFVWKWKIWLLLHGTQVHTMTAWTHSTYQVKDGFERAGVINVLGSQWWARK